MKGLKSITRYNISKILNISPGHFSDILNGKKFIGRKASQKIAKVANRPWREILIMPPEELENMIRKSIERREETT